MGGLTCRICSATGGDMLDAVEVVFDDQFGIDAYVYCPACFDACDFLHTAVVLK